MGGIGFSKYGLMPKSLSKKFDKILFGTKDKTKKLGLQSPEQEALTKSIIDGLMSGKGPYAEMFKEFDQSSFDEGVSKPALQNFQDNILPMLQEKFSSNGYQGTPTAARELNKAGTGLQSTLANLLYQAKTGHNKENLTTKLNLTNTALGVKPHENLYKQGDPGLLQGIVQGGAANVAKMAIAG